MPSGFLPNIGLSGIPGKKPASQLLWWGPYHLVDQGFISSPSQILLDGLDNLSSFDY